MTDLQLSVLIEQLAGRYEVALRAAAAQMPSDAKPLLSEAWSITRQMYENADTLAGKAMPRMHADL